MSDKTERAERGYTTSQEILGTRLAPPTTPFTEAARDFVFSEVWARDGLDRRSRRWITLTAVCASGSDVAIHAYLKASLQSDDITESELREFVLQFAVFQGFPKAAKVELMLNAMVAERAA